jgi:hypothetical protein
MGIYRTISVTFWTDPKVVDFSAEDRYMMLYLLTNPHANITGCFEINFRQMAFEMGHSTESVVCIIERLAEKHKIIQYCQQTSEILILNWYKYNWSGGSPNVLKAVKSSAESIKCDEFREYVLDKVNNFGNKEESNKEEITVNSNTVNSNSNIIVGIGYEYPIDRVSKDSSKKSKKHVNKLFSKPTIEEIAEYCHERNNTVDPEAFYAFYESNGWKVGKNPMKSWKMAVITWEKNNFGNGKRGSDPFDVRNQYWDESDPTVH